MKKLLIILTMLISATALADNTSFNPNSVALAPRTTDTTPIGTVVIWSNNQAFPDINGNTVWLPCNGQEIPSGIEYDELRTALASSNLPNYNNDQFLQGATSNIGQEVAEQSKIHTVDIPAHKHDLAGGVAGGQTIVSGGAGGQGFEYLGITTFGYSDRAIANDEDQLVYVLKEGSGSNERGTIMTEYQVNSMISNNGSFINGWGYQLSVWAPHYGQKISISCRGGEHFFYKKGDDQLVPLCMRGVEKQTGSTSGGSIYGTTSTSGLSGTTGAAGATTMTIKDTTAPAHTKVMYYIKARD